MSGFGDGALLEQFKAGKRSALARTISLVENRAPGFEKLLHEIHPSLGRARRVGITGPPGAGKSTLTAWLTAHLRSTGLTVGVVAVDPSSPFTGGALLGDRIRMGIHSNDAGVFIRSMSARGLSGGVAAATSEAADLLDAFGFDVVLLEAVGAGQSELAIADCVDSTVLVITPESGDAVQAMKAGLMEVADIVVINKTDRPGAENLAREVEGMLRLREPVRSNGARGATDITTGDGEETVHGKSLWRAPVLLTTAQDGTGLELLARTLEEHRAHLVGSGELALRRRRRWASRTRAEVERELLRRTWTEQREGVLAEGIEAMESGRESPYSLALRIAGSARNE